MSEDFGAHVRPGDGSWASFDLPAQVGSVSVLRTAAASLAAILGYTVDEVEDLRIAVHEATAMLLGVADPHTRLECRLQRNADRLHADLSVHASAPQLPDQNCLAWQLLRQLTDSAQLTCGSADRVTLTLTAAGGARPQATATPPTGEDQGNGHSDRGRDSVLLFIDEDGGPDPPK